MPDKTDKVIRKMGRYTLVDKLGQGSMGVVYKAYDEMLDRYVALKTMVSDMTSDTELRKRFYQEARLAAKLNHPYIITVHDLGEVDGQLYIAMELLAGQDLKAFIREGGQLSLEQTLEWMIQLADAFAFAHQEGIIHRDIKPGNIQIRENNELVVMDFGIARAASSDITRAGAIIGTPEYISPEQILAIRIDSRADIFSLGLVFYELLTRTHPFRGPNLPATIHKVLNEKAPPPNEINPQIPQRLSDLVLKCMEKDMNKRYQSCQEVLAELVICRDDLKRQAREMVASRGTLYNDLIQYIGRLQDLYPRKEFLQICEELGYDPSSGTISDPVLPEEPTYSQASNAYTTATRRVERAIQFIESSSQLEGIMQSGKAFYTAQRYSECIDQMNLLLAYSPGHELALEYIEQCKRRMEQRAEEEQRRLYIIETEQAIMNTFQRGDLTGAHRQALTLLGYDPENTIAKGYVRKIEDAIRLDQEKKQKVVDSRESSFNRAISLRNRGELQKSLSLLLDLRKQTPDSADIAREIVNTENEIRSSEEYQKKLSRKETPVWIYPSMLAFIAAIILFGWWLFRPQHSNEDTQKALSLARSQMQQGQFEKCMNTLQDYLKKDPANTEAQALLDDAKRKLAQQMDTAQKQKVEGMIAEARKFSSASQYQKAIEEYESILRFDPLNQTAQNELTAARSALAASLNREKLAQQIASQYAAAEKEFKAGHYARAKLQLDELLQLDPENAEAKKMLALAQSKLSEEQNQQDDATKLKGLLASARSEFQKKNYDRALGFLDDAAKLAPDNPDISSLKKQIQSEVAKPRFGSVTINCEPFGTAFIDGQQIGDTPIPMRKMEAGQHVVTIRRNGFKEISKTILIKEDEVQHLQFTLQKDN